MFISNIITSFENWLWVKKQTKIDPLQYSYILNETHDYYGSVFGDGFSIEDNLCIESFITSDGIQSCGLYFKVKRFEYLDGGKVLDMCRISMERPEYITGFDETFVLTEEQKMKLINRLNMYIGGDNKTTLWEYLFDSMNSGRNTDRCKDCNLSVLPMPNYLLLH